MSEIIAFRGIYGHKSHTHALLAHTPECEVFTSLGSIESDLPAEAPAGIVWQPFFRGWIFKEHYFFSRTQPDITATRPGMVRTQILTIAIEQVQRLKSLVAVFPELEVQWDEAAGLSPVNIQNELGENPRNRPPPSALLLHLGQKLAAGVADDSPIVVCGEAGFPSLVNELWQRMPPPFRRELVFGFTFTPTDLKQRGLDLACCPTGLAERWRGYAGFLRDGETSQPVSRACGYLLGLPEGRHIEKFIDEAALGYPSPKTLPAYDRAATDWANRSNLDFDGLCSLARDLAQLAPEPSQATEIKLQVAADLADKIKRGGSDSIMPLRNLRVSPFAGAATSVGNAVSEWVVAHLSIETDAANEELLTVLDAVSRPASADWQQWVSAGIRKVLMTTTERVARSIWQLWGKKGELFEIVAALAPADSKNESAWAKTVPARLDPTVGAKVAGWARERSWWLLHAKVLLATSPWELAARRHLEELPEANGLVSVRTLLEAPPVASAVLFAARDNDARLHQCAADIAVSNPEVFAGFDGKQRGWRTILRLAIASNARFVCLLPSARDVLFSLVDALLAGEKVESGIFAAFAHGEFADLSKHPQRRTALPALPANVREDFLNATAVGWFHSFFDAPTVPTDLEQDLRAKLFAPTLKGKRFPKSSQNMVPAGLILFQTFQNSTEDCFIEWLDSVASSAHILSSHDAEKIASLLKRRAWESAAVHLKRLADRSHRSDITHAWETYWHSLGKLERLLFRLIGPSGSPSMSQPGHAYRAKHMDSQTQTALFVTALASEFKAVCSHLRDVEEEKIKGTIYSVGQLAVGESSCEVVVVQTGMGNSKAAVETERAIEGFGPQYAFFVGIAGGLKDDLKLGDVVAADKVYSYEAGKAATSFRPRPEAPWISHEAVQRAQVVAREDNWIKRITPTSKTPPSAFVKPVAAGEKVIDSHRSEIYKLIKQVYGDAYAVAMEDFGFAYAAHANKGVTFAVVRGISDFAAGKASAEKENSQEIAAINAAAFAMEMLAGLIGEQSTRVTPQLETKLL
jgi:nucleoside phosphorylase